MDVNSSFDAFFIEATRPDQEPGQGQRPGLAPFPYQRRLATAELLPHIVDVPTGLGKTAALILGWLWRRRGAPVAIREQTPRRLVYCLPMRVLIEQTRDKACWWLKQLGLADQVQVVTLMGGEPEDQPADEFLKGHGGVWDIHPEREAILIGTQDMLLSRALNRGYGMSRFRWPLHFGLLNNDCLWIYDEVQLMGVGLGTTLQLAAFRREMGTQGPFHSIWASATLAPEWLKTIDFKPEQDASRILSLEKDDLKNEIVLERRSAKKPLQRARTPMGHRDQQGFAEEIWEAHRQTGPHTRTLIIINTVDRAQRLYESLQKLLVRETAAPELLLIHSRFRPEDRKRKVKQLLAPPAKDGMIIVSTQVVEAGVDFSATVLFSELCPYSSLVQRFGRCNRYGKENQRSRIFWVDFYENEGSLPEASEENKKDNEAGKLASPYELDPINVARKWLLQHAEAGSEHLSSVSDVAREPEFSHLIRDKDLLDLFDTTPDLSGNNVDISRFIRDATDTDLQVFWRAGPGEEALPPERQELCSVPVGHIRKLLDEGRTHAWIWDAVNDRWRRLGKADSGSVRPGMEVMLEADAGLYSEETGWNPRLKGPKFRVTELGLSNERRRRDDRYDRDPWSDYYKDYVLLAKHSQDVYQEACEIANVLHLPDNEPFPMYSTFVDAARWHDAGKAHPVFQNAVRGEGAPLGLLAKSKKQQRYERRGFRHELASALLALLYGKSDLFSYLVASHHGKVRLSIRSLPREKPPSLLKDRKPWENKEKKELHFARGIWHDDLVPCPEETIDLGDGIVIKQRNLDLSYMDMGEGERGPSWLARALALRDHKDLGPFRLAYLEALIKAADERASAKEACAAGGGER